MEANAAVECATLPVAVFPLLSLPDDVLGVLLKHVRPRYRGMVLRCCKRLQHVALSRAYPPWVICH